MFIFKILNSTDYNNKLKYIQYYKKKVSLTFHFFVKFFNYYKQWKKQIQILLREALMNIRWC